MKQPFPAGLALSASGAALLGALSELLNAPQGEPWMQMARQMAVALTLVGAASHLWPARGLTTSRASQILMLGTVGSALLGVGAGGIWLGGAAQEWAGLVLEGMGIVSLASAIRLQRHHGYDC